jgi:hypothetical protein
MSEMIDFVDGNSGQVLRRVPFEQVPLPNREIYRRAGRLVDRREDADEVVPIARVVRIALDEAGNYTDADDAPRVIVREYDRAENLLRETLMVPR